MYVHMYAHVCLHVPQVTSGDQMTAWESQASPSTTWVPGVELKPLEAFAPWVVSQGPLKVIFLVTYPQRIRLNSSLHPSTPVRQLFGN